ncbi:MAG: toprim domain-containing protein [Paraperlucidibaca sp.]|nr:toprim domain-containing protein [Paraperlucidibaca sp.]MBQ0722300.1 toprim domain-containing protein [Paraperlucidibaca sp.]
MSYVMDNGLRSAILDRLQTDYGLKARGNWLRQGECPSCQKKELYINSETPWILRCGRLSKCGAEIAVKDVYSDLFDDWSSRYKVTETEPNATAAAYLQFCRGFDPQITAGEFTQENFYLPELKAGSATVRFALERGSYWERLIDRPHRFGKMKALFKKGSHHKGTWWRPARVDLTTVKELWIVEGIFDAIALLHHGIDAVASMSSNQFPEDSLNELLKTRGADLPKLVWALDGDKAGASFAKKFVKQAREMGFECGAATVALKDSRGKRLDWNDMHLRDKLDAANIAECRYQGALVIAESPSEKARLMYMQTERREFWFAFDNRTFWFKFDTKRYDEAMKSLEESKKAAEMNDEQRRAYALQQGGIVAEIANCFMQTLYHQRAEVTDETWYYVRVAFPHGGPEQKMAFTPSQLSSSGDFKKKILNAAGAWWLGSQHQLDIIMKGQTYNIKSVETIDYIGYSREHKTYLLGDLAVRQGVVSEINEEDFFDFGKLRVKSLMKGVNLKIKRDDSTYRDDWFGMLWQCFGEQATVTLAFWLGSLFCEQIRAEQKSFPFLELTGEAGAGKTTLLMFMWKLFGREYEGFDPSKSSIAGRSRAMGQVAGMPVVLIEGDRSGPDKAHAKSFDWDELKDFFGGGTLRTRGVRNGGNDTYEPPFRGTICISQNADVSASEAILTRLIKMSFKRRSLTSADRDAADSLNMMPTEQTSYFIIKAARLENQIMALFLQRSLQHEHMLRGMRDIRIERIIKNHAQLMALVDCLKLVTPITDDQVAKTHQALTIMALDRQVAINSDHSAVHQFWEVYDYIEMRNGDLSPALNHSGDPSLIAINLNDFAENASFHKQQIAELSVLRELLKTSRRHAFIESNRPVHSVIRAAGGVQRSVTVKCWIFKKSH